ncbi:hypothetical protein [Microbacterium sp. NPDC056569]|uniref:hypothetical protein n=1 Tax=Microbacterium sp. NPDC056569 TaxID=3345867 RepID=UPI00366B4653
MTSPTARPLGTVVTIDLRRTRGNRYAASAWQTRHTIRHQLAELQPSDVVKLKVNRWSLVSDVFGLIPTGTRVQVSADAFTTVRDWERALEVRR